LPTASRPRGSTGISSATLITVWSPTDLDAEGVADQVTSMLDKSAAIRNDLAGRLPGVQRAALSCWNGVENTSSG